MTKAFRIKSKNVLHLRNGKIRKEKIPLFYHPTIICPHSIIFLTITRINMSSPDVRITGMERE